MGVRRVGRQPRVSPEGRPRRDLPSGATAPSSQLLATSSRPLETRAEEDDRKAEERHAGRSSWPASEPKREEGERRVRAEEARVRRLRAEVEAWREAAHVRTYLDALQRRLPELGDEERARIAAWCDWAGRWVERADPVIDTSRIVSLDDEVDASSAARCGPNRSPGITASHLPSRGPCLNERPAWSASALRARSGSEP